MNNDIKDPENFVYNMKEESNSKLISDKTILSDERKDILTEKNIEGSEQIIFEATDDESMAVEALRQLGGMYEDIVTVPQDLAELSCNTCSMRFETSSGLCSHTIICRAQSWKCTVCDLSFFNEQSYHNHKCILAQLPCKYCYINFSTSNDLEKHIEANHATERPYNCNFCKMTFIKSSSLANHQKIHNYLPGRQLIDNTDNMVATNSMTTFLENVYPENCINYNWNNSLLQKTIELNLNKSEDVEITSERVNFETPVKIEVIPFMADIGNCLDETFPINNVPQMEITISTDPKKPYICNECSMTFSREKALINHQNLHSVGWSFKHECENCCQIFPDQNSIQEHNKSCGVINPIDQDIPKKQKNENVKSQVKVGKHRCSECEKSFTTKQKMFRHLWIHRKKSFSCELCAMNFAVQTELDRHRIAEHPTDSPYVCNECGKSFASRQGLWEHGRAHGGGPAGLLSCNDCNKTFASRQGFLIHQRTHTDERPYGCRFCLKAFRDGGTLRKHERIHTGYRPYVCPLCSHDFNQKVVLREHVRWVHTASKVENVEGLFECQICNVSLSDREELCAHIVKHSDLLASQSKNNDVERVRTHKKSDRVKRTIPKKNKLEYEPVNIEDTEQDQYNIECDMCGDKFKTQDDLKTHAEIHK